MKQIGRNETSGRLGEGVGRERKGRGGTTGEQERKKRREGGEGLRIMYDEVRRDDDDDCGVGSGYMWNREKGNENREWENGRSRSNMDNGAMYGNMG